MYRRLWRHRDLVISLIRRQYQLRYRQTMAGFAWAIVPSLITLGAATLVFHKVARIETGAIPYPVFVFAALAPWTFFSSSLNFGVPSVIQGQAMLTRLAFPRAALPLSMVGLALVDLAVASVTFVAFAYAMGEGLPVTAVWYPGLLLIEIVLTVGIVLFTSALNVFARDVKLAAPLLVQLWLFLTPVMYPLTSVPQSLRGFYDLNPMTGLVESFRRVLLYGQPPDPAMLLPTVVGAVGVLALGSWYFAATEARFADVI